MSQPEWTKEEMFASIKASGLSIDESQFQELRKHGLIMPGCLQSKGRYGSKPGLWTSQQRDLLHILCHERGQQKMHSIAVLCNIPISLWLYWGDNAGVPLEQVKQIMKTWAVRQKEPSLTQSRLDAGKILQDVGNHPEGGKRQAISTLANLFYQGRFTEQDLIEPLYRVFDQRKKPNGPDTVPQTPESVSKVLSLSWKAAQWIAQADNLHLPDSWWQWARVFLLQGLAWHLQEWSGYSMGDVAGGFLAYLLTSEMIKEIRYSACADLATMLYLGNDDPNPLHLPEPLRLTYWQDCVKSATITGQSFASPIVHDGSILLKVTVATVLRTREDNPNSFR